MITSGVLADRAVLAARSAAARFGVRCVAPVVLSDGANVIAHLAPAPVVARVATLTALVRPDVAATPAKDVALAQYLAGRNTPVATPSAELPAGPHLEDGHAITFRTYLDLDPSRSVGVDEVGPLLADLHSALRDYPGDLPTAPDRPGALRERRRRRTAARRRPPPATCSTPPHTDPSGRTSKTPGAARSAGTWPVSNSPAEWTAAPPSPVILTPHRNQHERRTSPDADYRGSSGP